MLRASTPWDAMICAIVSNTLSRTPLLLQDSQNPLCTMGRLRMSFDPLLGKWSVRQVCAHNLFEAQASLYAGDLMW